MGERTAAPTCESHWDSNPTVGLSSPHPNLRLLWGRVGTRLGPVELGMSKTPLRASRRTLGA